jgi:hypothetical protein
LSIGVLCSACRPVYLTAHLRGGITCNGTNGILHLAAKVPGSAFNAIFIHVLILLIPPGKRAPETIRSRNFRTRGTIEGRREFRGAIP